MECREQQDKKCSLRKQYDLFLTEDQRRKERNAQILQRLDNITQKANQLQYRADRVKSLKWRDQSPPTPLPDQFLRIPPSPYGLAPPYNPPRIPPYYYESQNQDLYKPELSTPNPNIPPQVPMFYPMQYATFGHPQPPQYVNNLTVDDIVKEISKKYILIPRRTTETLNKEDAHERHPNNGRNVESDVSWRDKYDILDKLHNNDDTIVNGKSKAACDEKLPIHEPAGSSKINLNEMKTISNNFDDWQSRLHGKYSENDNERVKLTKENDKSYKEVYFANDESKFEIQPKADTQSRFHSSVKQVSLIKDIEICTDEIKVVASQVNTPTETNYIVNSAEPGHDTIKPELASDDVNTKTNSPHNGKVYIPKTESNENELDVSMKENIQANQVEYVQPNEETIQEKKSNHLPTQKTQPEEYYQETDYQNPGYDQDPNSNYNVQYDPSEHNMEQNQEQHIYTNQHEMFQEEHPANVEHENPTSAQEYYDQNPQQNEAMNSEMVYEHVVEPNPDIYTEYAPDTYTEDQNGQYAVLESNESIAVDGYQNETVTEKLHAERTYENQHLTHEGEYTQNPNEVVDNGNNDEQNIPPDYNHSEQPQPDYDQTNYQQYDSNDQQVYEEQYYQEQDYPETHAEVGNIAAVEQEYVPVDSQVEQDAKPVTHLESNTDPYMREQSKQDSEFDFSGGKLEVGKSENN